MTRGGEKERERAYLDYRILINNFIYNLATFNNGFAPHKIRVKSGMGFQGEGFVSRDPKIPAKEFISLRHIVQTGPNPLFDRGAQVEDKHEGVNFPENINLGCLLLPSSLLADEY